MIWDLKHHFDSSSDGRVYVKLKIAVKSVFFCWENNIVTMPCPFGEKHKDWCAQVIKNLSFGQKKRNKERTQL